MIGSFSGKYRFLSNFYTSAVTFEGITYENAEAAFQSAKTTDIAKRAEFAKISPSEAKRKGRKIELRNDWETVKYEVMYKVCLAKFTQNESLKQMLLATGDEYLEEGNTWGDRCWGTVNGVGENHLGKTLMRVREEVRGLE